MKGVGKLLICREIYWAGGIDLPEALPWSRGLAQGEKGRLG